MKKFFLSLLAVILIIIIILYGVLFTATGNDFVKNFAEKEAIKNGINLKINEFKLDLNELKIAVVYDEFLDFKLGGNYSLFKQNLDFKFSANAADLKRFGIDEKIDAKGKIAGKFSDFDVVIDGNVFESALQIRSKIFDYFPQNLVLNLDDLDVEKLNKIAGVDYASGVIKIAANIDKIDAKTFQASGGANINALLNLKENVKKDFGIEIKDFGQIRANIAANLNGFEVLPDIKVDSKILEISSKFEPINLEKLEINGKIITKLRELKFINEMLNSNLLITSNVHFLGNLLDINSQIQGKNIYSNSLKLAYDTLKNQAEINGDLRLDSAFISMPKSELLRLNINAKYANDDLSAFAKGLILGAKSQATMQKNTLTASIKELKFARIAKLLELDDMLNASINLDAKINDLAKLKGSANVDIKGATNVAYFQKEYDLAIDSRIFAKANALLNGAENITFDTVINSDYVDEIKANGKLINGEITAKYNAFAKLKNLSKLLERNLSGEVEFAGDAKIAKNTDIKMYSKKFFGGKLNARLLNDDFDANLYGVSLEALANNLDFIDLYRTNLDAKMHYNIKSERGKITANAKEGRLKPSKGLDMLNKLLKTDIEKIVFYNSNALVNLNKEMIFYEANLLAQNAQIHVKKGDFSTATNLLNAPISLVLNGNELRGKFYGTSEDVRFAIDSKSVQENIQKAAKKVAKKELEKLEEKYEINEKIEAEKERLKDKLNDKLKSKLKGLFK